MNLFYYIYYRLAHFYRRCGTPSPDLSAYNVLYVIQILTVAIWTLNFYYQIIQKTQLKQTQYTK